MGKAIMKFGWKQGDLVVSTKIYWGMLRVRRVSIPLVFHEIN